MYVYQVTIIRFVPNTLVRLCIGWKLPFQSPLLSKHTKRNQVSRYEGKTILYKEQNKQEPKQKVINESNDGKRENGSSNVVVKLSIFLVHSFYPLLRAAMVPLVFLLRG